MTYEAIVSEYWSITFHLLDEMLCYNLMHTVIGEEGALGNVSEE